MDQHRAMLGTQTCGSWDSSLTERARHACGSPLDLRVRDAMQAVHAKGIFGPADFPKETIHLLAALAARHAKARLDNMPQRVDCGR